MKSLQFFLKERGAIWSSNDTQSENDGLEVEEIEEARTAGNRVFSQTLRPPLFYQNIHSGQHRNNSGWLNSNGFSHAWRHFPLFVPPLPAISRSLVLSLSPVMKVRGGSGGVASLLKPGPLIFYQMTLPPTFPLQSFKPIHIRPYTCWGLRIFPFVTNSRLGTFWKSSDPLMWLIGRRMDSGLFPLARRIINQDREISWV